jgi:hypothetical protein
MFAFEGKSGQETSAEQCPLLARTGLQRTSRRGGNGNAGVITKLEIMLLKDAHLKAVSIFKMFASALKSLDPPRGSPRRAALATAKCGYFALVSGVYGFDPFTGVPRPHDAPYQEFDDHDKFERPRWQTGYV